MGDPVTQACAQAFGSAVVPVSDAIKATYRTLKRQYDYVRKLERNFSLFEKAEQDLCDKESYVKRVIELNAPRRETSPQAETWLNNVLAQKLEIMRVKMRYKASPKSLYGMCPFCSLRRLGKCIVRQTTRITALLGEMTNDESDIVIRREAERVESTDSKKIDGLESLYENVKELLMNLDDPGKKRIGIWGDAGVGKTTILKSLIKELENRPHMFDVVIMVEVGKEWSVPAIHKEIVGRLKLDVEGIDTENEVAGIISKALAKRKYLLLLDEVFSELNLGNVGIHEHHQQGKLVMACRSRFVLHKMDLNNEIKVKGLSEDDGQVLFRELVGPATFDRPRIKPIAERVAKQCGHYPQVIKAMASYLKDERSEDVWNNTLSHLTSPNGRLLDEMEDMVKALGMVYDLKLNEDRKKCLKYGAILPEDYEMYQDYLIECWKAQNCLENVQTMKRAREEGHTVLKDLISYCLLEKGKTEEHVKMSTICRMMARRKYQENELFVGENGGIFEEEEEEQRYPSEEQWAQAKMISLICSNLQECHLPASPECSTISTLLLQKNKNLKRIPSEFFKQMPQLNVLDLYSTGIDSLPPSVSNLRNIKALYLNHCPLVVGLPDEIQILKNLEVFDIRGTGIRSFPTEVGAMSSLRCLRVSFTCCVGNLNHAGNQNHVIGPSQISGPTPNYHQVVGRLSLLEELVVDVDPSEPICKELLNQIATGVGQEILDNVAIEIASLTRLTYLCFYFPSLRCFETFITERQSRRPAGRLVDNFRSFQIQVGRHIEHHHRHRLDIAGCSARRHFRYSAGRDTSGPPPTSVTEVLKHACSFELIGHADIQSLSELGINAMKCLEVCIIEECIGMKKILLGGNQTVDPVLPYLEKLHLSGLHNLDCIWEGSIVLGSLASLTTLTLSDCPNIEKILSLEMAKQLPELRHLRVENCPRLVEVIEADQTAQTTPARTSSQTPPNQPPQTNPTSISSQSPPNQSSQTTPGRTSSQAPPNQPPQTNQVGTLLQSPPNQLSQTTPASTLSKTPPTSKLRKKFFQCFRLPSSLKTNQHGMPSQHPANQLSKRNHVGNSLQAHPNMSPHTNKNGTLSQTPLIQSPKNNQVGTLSQASPNQSTQINQVGSSSQASYNPSHHTNQASTSSQAPPNQSTKINQVGSSSQALPNQSPHKNQVGTLSQSPPNQSTQTTPAGTSSQAPANQLPPTHHPSTSSPGPSNQLAQKNQASTSSQSPPNQLSQATPTGNLLQAHPNQTPQKNQAGTSSQALPIQLLQTTSVGTSAQAPSTPKLKTKLMTLQLIRLPMLVSIYGAQTNQVSTSIQAPPSQPSQTIQVGTSSQAPPVHILEWTCLKQLEIRDCMQLHNLSLTTNNAPWLRSIECDEGWWRGLNFHDNELKSNLEHRCCRFQ